MNKVYDETTDADGFGGVRGEIERPEGLEWMKKQKFFITMALISISLSFGSIPLTLIPLTVFASTEKEEAITNENSNSSKETISLEEEEGTTDADDHINSEEQRTSETPTPILTVNESNSCDLPNDGREQPSKGADMDPHTWEVVPMRDDPSLFKVVDDAGINVADQFQSKANAEQYVAHFVCDSSSSPTPPPLEPDQAEVCNDGIDNDFDGSIDENCPQLPDESGPNLPDFGSGGPPELAENVPGSVPDYEPNYRARILLPTECVTYDVPLKFKDVSLDSLNGKTCAKVFQNVVTGDIEVLVRQWFQDQVVYEGILSYANYRVQVYNGGLSTASLDFYYTFTLNLDFVNDSLGLLHKVCHNGTCIGPPEMKILDWTSYITKILSINVGMSDIHLRYNSKDASYLQNFIEYLNTGFKDDIKKSLESKGAFQVGDITVNYSARDP